MKRESLWFKAWINHQQVCLRCVAFLFQQPSNPYSIIISYPSLIVSFSILFYLRIYVRILFDLFKQDIYLVCSPYTASIPFAIGKAFLPTTALTNNPFTSHSLLLFLPEVIPAFLCFFLLLIYDLFVYVREFIH